MKRAAFALAALLALLVAACPPPDGPTTPPPADPDGGDYPGPDGVIVEVDGSVAAASSPCGKACEGLRKIPCREGYPTAAGISCYRGCIAMAQKQRVPTACWALAKTPADARACGGIRCLTP